MAAMEIVARIKLAGEEFTRDFTSRMDRIESEAKSTSNRVSSAFGILKAGIGGALAGIGISEIAQAGKRALQYADDLDAVAKQVNINVERFQTLKEGFRALEVDSESFDQAMKRLTDTLGDVQNGTENGATKALDRMGIKQRILAGEIRTTDQLLDAIAGTATRYGDAARFASDANEIFGRRVGVEMAAALADGGAALNGFEQQMRASGTVIDDALIAKLADANEKIDAFTERMKRQMVIAGGAIVDFGEDAKMTFDSLTDAFDAPTARWGEAIGIFTTGAKQDLRSLSDVVLGVKGMIDTVVNAQRRIDNGWENFWEETTFGLYRATPKPMSNQAGEFAADMRRRRNDALLREVMSNDMPFGPLGGASPRRPVPTVAEASAETPRGARSSRAVKSEAEREEEKKAEAYRRIEESLDKQTEEMEQQLKIDGLRRQGLEVEADVQEAINRLLAANSNIAGKTVEQIMEQTGKSREQVRAEFDKLDVLKQQTEERVRGAAADDAAKKLTAERVAAVEEAVRSAEEEMERVDQMRRDQVNDLADFYRTAFSDGADGIWRDFKDQGLDAIALIAAQWTLAMLSGQNMSFGDVLGSLNTGMGSGNPLLQALGGLFDNGKGGPHVGTYGSDHGESPLGWVSSVLPGDQPTPGASAPGLGGMMGSISAAFPPLAAGMAITSTLSSLFGVKNVAGGIFGIVGNLFASLFSSTKKGSASIGFDQYGELGVTSTAGNSKKRIAAASDAAGSLAGMIENIAEQLGGSIGGTPTLSLGLRKDNWRLDPTGAGRTKGSGVLDFGDDQEAAVRAAISELLKDGVIQGISDASKRILQSGQDLERAITKAAMIEEIPKLLKARLDPVGAALDELNDRWEKVWDALEEGAASAEQMAEAQQLYNLELKETRESVRATSESLKAFLDDLKVGPSSPYSLRDQEAAAVAALQPYLDQINAGQAIDQQKYLEVAQNYLDIERQLYGSTSQFFAAMDQVQAATNAAIAQIDNAAPIATAADPFIKETASNTKTMTEQLDQVSQQLANMAALMGGTGTAAGSAFIAGDPRAYAVL